MTVEGVDALLTVMECPVKLASDRPDPPWAFRDVMRREPLHAHASAAPSVPHRGAIGRPAGIGCREAVPFRSLPDRPQRRAAAEDDVPSVGDDRLAGGDGALGGVEIDAEHAGFATCGDGIRR